MKNSRVIAALLCLVSSWLLACDDDSPKSTECTVEQLTDGLTVTCDNGSSGTVRLPGAGEGGVNGELCLVTDKGDDVVIQCPDGSTVTVPGGGAHQGDAGVAVCTVTQGDDGTITITCPDGTQATIFG